MILDLLAHKDYLRVLHAVAKTPKRFGALQRELKLNPAQVDRAVKFLSREKLIALGLADTATYRALMVYNLTKRGAAFLEAFGAFAAGVEARKDALGPDAVADLRGCRI